MRLYFLRHGAAEDASKYKNDRERPLSKKGSEAIKHEIHNLKHFPIKFDIIIHSPYLRAKQTAETTAKELHLNNKLCEDEALSSGCNAENLLAMLELYKDYQNILLVGHEPDFGLILGNLLDLNGALSLKKGGLAAIDLDLKAKEAELILFLHPDYLK